CKLWITVQYFGYGFPFFSFPIEYPAIRTDEYFVSIRRDTPTRNLVERKCTNLYSSINTVCFVGEFYGIQFYKFFPLAYNEYVFSYWINHDGFRIHRALRVSKVDRLLNVGFQKFLEWHFF